MNRKALSMHDRTSRLVEVSRSCAGDSDGSVVEMAKCLLACPANIAANWTGMSGINSDGSPLQFCLSAGSNGIRRRLLGDPACMVTDLEERYRLGHSALLTLISLTNTHELFQPIQEMLDEHLGERQEHIHEYPDGVLWLGAATGSAGLAVYMDARRGGPQAATERVQQWMQRLMPQSKEVQAVLGNIFKNARLMSLGLEGSNLKDLRAKIYWRMDHPGHLDTYAVPLLAAPALKEFLQKLVKDKPIQLKSIVFSAGFHLASQQLFDIKADVCNCKNCLGFSNQEWKCTLDEFCRDSDIHPFMLDDILVNDECLIAFFGMGLNIKNERRYNIYLKAPQYEYTN